ncbi:hypothetical protein EV361DRAFT_923921 [Lentinula raphanica]|nr:hypothetical protein EV361DRAFT_923921 [Lentinula raphanica]
MLDLNAHHQLCSRFKIQRQLKPRTQRFKITAQTSSSILKFTSLTLGAHHNLFHPHRNRISHLLCNLSGGALAIILLQSLSMDSVRDAVHQLNKLLSCFLLPCKSLVLIPLADGSIALCSVFMLMVYTLSQPKF